MSRGGDRRPSRSAKMRREGFVQLLTNVGQYTAYTRRPVSCNSADNRSRCAILHRLGLCRAYTRRPEPSSLGGIHSRSHGGRLLTALHHDDRAIHHDLGRYRNLGSRRGLAAHSNLVVHRNLGPRRNHAARHNLAAADNKAALPQARSQAPVHPSCQALKRVSSLFAR
jgi:hypothetical protein